MPNRPLAISITIRTLLPGSRICCPLRQQRRLPSAHQHQVTVSQRLATPIPQQFTEHTNRPFSTRQSTPKWNDLYHLFVYRRGEGEKIKSAPPCHSRIRNAPNLIDISKVSLPAEVTWVCRREDGAIRSCLNNHLTSGCNHLTSSLCADHSRHTVYCQNPAIRNVTSRVKHLEKVQEGYMSA